MLEFQTLQYLIKNTFQKFLKTYFFFKIPSGNDLVSYRFVETLTHCTALYKVTVFRMKLVLKLWVRNSHVPSVCNCTMIVL